MIWLSRMYVWVSALAFLSVALMAFADPQSVMDLVQVKLQNTDARSSIRGVYGGVGICIVFFLGLWSMKNLKLALSFLCIIWGGYVLSRSMTHFMDGPLGDFGQQWIWTEAFFLILGLALLWWESSKKWTT